MDYSYWIAHIERFKKQFGTQLEIDCGLTISEDSFHNIPSIGYGHILMPSQYLDLLNVHCNLILSNKNLFHSIGNPKNENLSRNSFEPIDYSLSSEEFRNKYLPFSFYNRIPTDGRRQKIAAVLRDLITYFAIHHELGHARQKSHQITLEISFGKIQNEMWDKQAKEVDADIFGINWLWRLIFKNYYPFISNETFNTKSEVLEICLYSTLLFFELSNEDSHLPAPDAFRSHPHPIIRLEIVSAFIEDIVTKNFLTKVEFYKVKQIVFKEFYKTCSYHFGKKIRKFQSDEIKKIISILEKYLKADLSLNCNRPYCVE